MSLIQQAVQTAAQVPWWTPIAAALVAGGLTLAGVFVTQQRNRDEMEKQRQHELDLKKLELGDAAFQRRIEIHREAYLAFLSAVDDLSVFLSDFAPNTELSPAKMEIFERLANAVRPAGQRLRLICDNDVIFTVQPIINHIGAWEPGEAWSDRLAVLRQDFFAAARRDLGIADNAPST